MVHRFNDALVAGARELHIRVETGMRREEGQTFAEYALVLALVALVAGAIIATVPNPLEALVTDAIDKVSGVINGG